MKRGIGHSNCAYQREFKKCKFVFSSIYGTGIGAIVYALEKIINIFDNPDQLGAFFFQGGVTAARHFWSKHITPDLANCQAAPAWLFPIGLALAVIDGAYLVGEVKKIVEDPKGAENFFGITSVKNSLEEAGLGDVREEDKDGGGLQDSKQCRKAKKVFEETEKLAKQYGIEKNS